MIIVDANLLIYAVNKDARHHAKAKRWFEKALSGDTQVGLPWIVLLAFIRICTRPGIMPHPLSCDQALMFVDEWLKQPYVSIIRPGENHWPTFRNLLQAVGASGNLTSDVHIAALAVELGATVYSADYDFQRFAQIKHVNPLAD